MVHSLVKRLPLAENPPQLVAHGRISIDQQNPLVAETTHGSTASLFANVSFVTVSFLARYENDRFAVCRSSDTILDKPQINKKEQ